MILNKNTKVDGGATKKEKKMRWRCDTFKYTYPEMLIFVLCTGNVNDERDFFNARLKGSVLT